MRKKIILPLFAAAAGFAGAFLRKMQRETGFEPDTGLAIAGNPWNLALIALSIIVVAILLAAVSGMRARETSGGFESGEGNLTHFIMAALGSLALIMACLLELYIFLERGDMLRNLLLPLLGLSAVICQVVYTAAIFKGADYRRFGGAAVIPVFFLCFLLVICYKERAADPVILDYVYEFFAVICGILSFYYASGFFFLRCRPKLLLLFSLLGIYFTLVTAADSHNAEEYLTFIYIGIYMLVHALSAISAAGFDNNPREDLNE
ncbi:MAG: hypothetical protein ACOX7P_02405 [Oscillospiraceae bacterium]|jgi:hypothetical protein